MAGATEKIRSKKADKHKRTRELYGKMTAKGTRQALENQKKKSEQSPKK